MPDLKDGESFFMQGSGNKPYERWNVGEFPERDPDRQLTG